MAATAMLNVSLRAKIRSGATLPTEGLAFASREEVTAWSKVHNCIRGCPDGSKLIKTEGKPNQKWSCGGQNCSGIVKINYVDGTRTPGVVVEATECTCPIRRNPPEESTGKIFRDTPDAVRASLVRFFHWEKSIVIYDYRATSPSGFQGNSDTHDILFRNDHPDLNVEVTGNRKRRRVAPKQKHFYGMLNNGSWFKVLIQLVKDPEGDGQKWTPVDIPRPFEAATQCKAMPQPDLADIVNVEPPEEEASTETRKKSGQHCITCHCEPAVNQLCCPSEGCVGGLLCANCTLRYTCTRHTPLQETVEPTWYKVNRCEGIPCLNRCPKNLVSHMLPIDSEDGQKLPLPIPVFFSYNRPSLTFKDVLNVSWAFDTFFHPIYEANLLLASNIAGAEHRLEYLHQQSTTCDSQPERVAIDREIAIEEIRIKSWQDQQSQVRFPDWASDWTMSKPLPRLSDLSHHLPEGPSGQDVLDYLAKFDLGHNPLVARQSADVVPSLSNKDGPLGKWMKEFTHSDIFGPRQEIKLNTGTQATDATALDVVDLANGSIETRDSEDSDYHPADDDDAQNDE